MLTPFHHHFDHDEKTPLLFKRTMIPPKNERTPLPRGQMTLLLFLRLVEPIAFTSIFSFVNQAVERDVTLVVDPSQVGMYSGFIESSFAFAQCMTVLGWGRASDIYGRKPIILFGVLGAACSLLAFGFSRTFYLMIISRMLSGLLNGNAAVVRTAVSEITDRSNETLAFSIIAACWPLGTSVGPFLSGILADPVKNYPKWFREHTLFDRFPYLLSCMACSAFSFIAFFMGLIWLKETRKRRTVDAQHRVEIVEPAIPLKRLLTRDVKNVLWHTSFLAFFITSMEAILPLVLYEPVQFGGLGLNEANIGKVLSSRALLSVFAQLAIFPQLQSRFGNVKSARILTMAFVVPVSLLSFTTILSKSGQITEARCFFALCLFTLAIAQTVFTSNFMLLNHACNYKSGLGTLNGCAQMLSALLRGFAPAFASSSFALSLNSPFCNGQAIFILLIFIVIFGIYTSLGLTEHELGRSESSLKNRDEA